MKVLCFGPAYIDINCLEFPVGDGLRPEVEVRGGPYEVALGGSSVNFARCMHALGAEAVVCGKVGHDVWADVLRTKLQESGVVPALLRDADVLTDIGINFVSPEGTTAMAVVGTAAKGWTPAELRAMFEDNVTGVSHVYIGGALKVPQLLPELARVVEECRRIGITTIMDHGRLSPTSECDFRAIRELTQAVDIYLPSRKEFLGVWGGTDVDAAAEKHLRESDPAHILVVKDGANGAIAFRQSERVARAAHPIKVTNTVGAGDCFNAGFIFAQNQRDDLTASTDFAICAASVRVAHNTLPTLDEIERFQVDCVRQLASVQPR